MVRGRPWLSSFPEQHKPELHSVLRSRVRVGFVCRQKQVEAVERFEQVEWFLQKQTAVASQLSALRRPFKHEILDLVRPWAGQYGEDRMRYQFLVIRGGSCSGKSTLAKALGEIFGFGQVFTQTVQDAPAPDLAKYDAQKHGFLLFDNVNSHTFVLDSRALFQANSDVHTLGVSRTFMYSYSVWLWKVPIVVTVDDSAERDSTEPWIAENAMEVLLPQKLNDGALTRHSKSKDIPRGSSMEMLPTLGLQAYK